MNGLKVQFGSGGNIIDGWENWDINTDVTKLPLPYGDNTVSMCFVEHMAEHINCSETCKFFEDIKRILKPGGVFRLCVPVVGVHLKRDHAKDLIIGHGHQQALDQNIVMTILWAAGFELPNMKITGREKTDGHWRVISKELDDIETFRIQATK